MAVSAVQPTRIGLGHWMQEVLHQCELASNGFGADPVHDLRTALRRCRSMADGIMVFDPSPSWKKMKKAGRQLFRSLGALRDTHVLQEWIEKLAPEDAVRTEFLRFLRQQENEAKTAAALALQQFDRKQWTLWAEQLPDRARRVPLNSPVFAHLALERWLQAHALHRRALRNRTNVAFHNLRIGIKRLRYTAENFLPGLHQMWGRDLKELQDALGDVHDLDVLWQTALKLRIFPDAASRGEWRSRIQQERSERLEVYRSKMIGNASLWPVWRAALPKPEELRALGFQRLEIWASFLDPHVRHSKHVSQLALQLFDGCSISGMGAKREIHRWILRASAVMHEVGHSRSSKGHHKISAHLIRKLAPPLGWTADELRTAALVARYHRGAIPRATQRNFCVLGESRRWLVQFLGGILRLACAWDKGRDNQIRRMHVQHLDPVLTVRAEGYDETTSLAQHLAEARYLLELACRRPVFVLPFDPKPHAA